MANNERKYLVKESWLFNVESSYHHLFAIIDDVNMGVRELPKTLLGKTIHSVEDIRALQQECFDLEWTIKWAGRVTGKEYGRIKEIVEWRVEERYVACAEAGNPYAGMCFSDL